MSLPFSHLVPYTGSLSAVSVLSETDANLFSTGSLRDIWYGISDDDYIELSVFSSDTEDQIAFKCFNQEKNFKTVTLTFLDNKDSPITYTYDELQTDFDIYKSEKILTHTVEQLYEAGIYSGEYKVSYNFVRLMAGNQNSPLTIKDISPSRKEIKLVPSERTDNNFTAFCLKKFHLRDVIPVVISVTKQCPYDQIYARVKDNYVNEINLLRTIFFLNYDGNVLTFLKELYEDFIKYTLLTTEQISDKLNPDKIYRIQGIRTYFNNYMLSNYDTISDFETLDIKFVEYVEKRVDQKFKPFISQLKNSKEFLNTRKFVIEFFVDHFYRYAINPLIKEYKEKYYSYLKNALNFGDNRFYTILAHDYLDERNSTSDPLTLIVKLSSELPTDISIKNYCWVTNYGMVPYVFNAVVQDPIKYPTTRIGAPNFNIDVATVSKKNVNKLYSIDDLKMTNTDLGDRVSLNKKISELNIDYTDFKNFVVFSSVATRLTVFKNKIVDWSDLSSSLVSLEYKYSSSLSSSVVYPYYTVEQSDYQTRMTDIINSFDGYESFLFKGGDYTYNINSGSFFNASYVIIKDEDAVEFDRNNRDSLVNNVPEYLVNDEDSVEYLTFLSMVGHHFDNIYTYISSLPIQKFVQNSLTSSLSTGVLKDALYSLGWNVSDLIGDEDIDDVYLNSIDNSSYNILSSEERLRYIWNRLLVTLPQIYKTKGTEACIHLLTSCYGIPSTLLSLREYGGGDYASDAAITYTDYKKVYMCKFNGEYISASVPAKDFICGPWATNFRTVEFAFSSDDEKHFELYEKVPIFTSIPWPGNGWPNVSWAIGVYKLPEKYFGKVFFQMYSGSTANTILTSSALPIFNGDVFSVMLRRNIPINAFNSSSIPTSSVSYLNNIDYIPAKYDLIVQRNEYGDILFQSTSSVILNTLQDNRAFSSFGKFYVGNTLTSASFRGTIDKIKIWDIPATNDAFNDYVNDYESYSYSGSDAYTHLWVDLHWNYPESLYTASITPSSVIITNNAEYYSVINYYNGVYTSSTDITQQSKSFEAQNRWRTYLPSGSLDIVAHQFPIYIVPNISVSYDSTICENYTASAFPYSFKELSIPQSANASKFGPSKFNNERIKKQTYTLESRLDRTTRSTRNTNQSFSPNSAQVGLFIDPQRARNEDILHYFGHDGIMDLIADPELMYSSNYPLLKNKQVEFDKAGIINNKRNLFNELISIYKFYIDKSVFQSIKNVMPARTTVATGIVIEPSVLERPKYKHQPMTSSFVSAEFYRGEMTAFREYPTADQSSSISSTLLWADPNIDFDQLMESSSKSTLKSSMPPNYKETVDLTYINYPSRNYPVNFVNFAYENSDPYQSSVYIDFAKKTRVDSGSSDGVPILGSISSYRPNDRPQVSNGSIDMHYVLKMWQKHHVYYKSGSHSKNDNLNDDAYVSSSVYLYKLIIVDDAFMKRSVYFKSFDVDGRYDPSANYLNGAYTHSINTFKGTPEKVFSNIIATDFNPINPAVFTEENNGSDIYFELFKEIYPRNHYTHKLAQFSKTRFVNSVGTIFIKGRQTNATTIGLNGITNNTYPVESFNVSNVNVINEENILNQ